MPEKLSCSLCKKSIGSIQYSENKQQNKKYPYGHESYSYNYSITYRQINRRQYLVICNICHSEHLSLSTQTILRQKFNLCQYSQYKLKEESLRKMNQLLTSKGLKRLEQYRQFLENISTQYPQLEKYINESKQKTLQNIQEYIMPIIQPQILILTKELQYHSQVYDEKIKKLQSHRQEKKLELQKIWRQEVIIQKDLKRTVPDDSMFTYNQKEISEVLSVFDKKINKLQEIYTILTKLTKKGETLTKIQVKQLKKINPEKVQEEANIQKDQHDNKSNIKGD